LLTTLCLATRAPIVIAPAMNQGMWIHTFTQNNVQILAQKGIHIAGPAQGSQACGDLGPGRMMEPNDLAAYLGDLFAHDVLSGLHVMVTAGPTHEAIDPVRYISNGSSGKMGFALAAAAYEAGAKVTLIHGPVMVPIPSRLDCISVTSAKEMYAAVMRKISECDIFLAVAAVGDYSVEFVAAQKIHKEEEVLLLRLIRNVDIVAEAGRLPNKPFIVGFAAETEDVIARAQLKRERKKMDIIVANQVGHGVAMGSDDNAVTVIGSNFATVIPQTSKDKLARQLIKIIASQFNEKQLS
jgi:phosphopantothenoylcysteine decarboxylase/phosphopantothenate--cysteine ligase